jgi:outer membrane protein assembly factor BamB
MLTKSRSSLGFFPGLLLALFILAGCAENAVAPSAHENLTPSGGPESSPTERYLWGEYLITLTDTPGPSGETAGVDFDIVPLRTSGTHFDVTSFVKPPSCADCVTIQLIEFKPGDPYSEATATVFLKNPTNLTGWDVRGIIYAPAGKLMLKGLDGLTRHDGLTTLYPQPGAPDENPYMAFNKGELLRPFEPHATNAVSYVLLKDNSFKFVSMVYKVDASWPSNAKEPVGAYVYPLTPDDHIYPKGSDAMLFVEVTDWQDNVSTVTLDMTSLGVSSPQEMEKISGNLAQHTTKWRYHITQDVGFPNNLRTIRLTAKSSDDPLVFMKDFEVKVEYDPDPPTWKVPGEEGIYDHISSPNVLWLFYREATDISTPLQYVFYGNNESSPFDGSVLKSILSTDYAGYTSFGGYDNQIRYYGIRLIDEQGNSDKNMLEYAAAKYTAHPRWTFIKGQSPPLEGIYGGPVIADVDLDGTNEIVIATRDGMVYVCAGNGTGTEDTTIFKTTFGEIPSAIRGAPAVANLYDDPEPENMEIIVGADNGMVYALKGEQDLPILWTFSTGSDPIAGSPSIAMMNDNPSPDVLIGSGSGELFALDGLDGFKIWSFTAGSAIASTPASADVTGDGTPDVCFGAYDNLVRMLDGETGDEIWEYNLGLGLHNVDCSPLLVDINQDEIPDCIIGGLGESGDGTGVVVALDGASPGPFATVLWIQEDIWGNARRSVAPAWINGDDIVDLVVTSWSTEEHSIYLLDGATGEIIYSKLGPNVSPTDPFNYSAPITGDFTGDGHVDAIYGRADGFVDLYNLSGANKVDGSVLPGDFEGLVLFSLQVSGSSNPEIDGPPAVGDVNGDGKLELVLCNMRGYTYAVDLYAPVPVDPELFMWPQFQGNRWHNGVPNFELPD